MRYSQQIILLFVLFIFGTTLIAGVPDGVNVRKSGSTYTIDFRLPGFQTSTKSIESQDFTTVTIPDYGITNETGYPQLPQISFWMIIPNGQDIPDVTYALKDAGSQQLTEHVYPKQMSWMRTRPLEERPLSMDEQYYQSSGRGFESFVKISEPFVVAGINAVMVSIYPFAYNPQTMELRYINRAEIELAFDTPVAKVNNRSASFHYRMSSTFVNYEAGSVESMMNYLIITAPEYEPMMNNFVAQKSAGGYNVTMVNTNATGTSNTSIKAFIQQLYDNTATRPEFILLVGDVDKIPQWTGTGTGSPDTDLNYTMLDGTDHFADAHIGRFSVADTADLSNMIYKTAFMDDFIGTLDKNNCWMASTDNYNVSEGTHNYCIDTYFDPAGYNNLKLYTVTYNATTTDLINALNDNKIFAVYSGHGGSYSWADGPQLSQAQVEGLTNTVYPFVYSFACITGSYQLSECFGETWLRTENGASTFIGSSVNSYWDEDDILERRLFKAMFDDDLTKVAPMYDKAKWYLVEHYGSLTSTMKRYLEMYNLMGDPSLSTVKVVQPDNTPPDPVTDLTVAGATSNTLQLSWTAPYDSTYGGIREYDIRYSQTPIQNDNDFNNATQIMLIGQADSAGTPKSFEIDDLDFSTTYYIAVKALDMWGNTSAMSNVTFEATWIAPVCSVTPQNVMNAIPNGVEIKDTVWLHNLTVDPSTLEYSVALMNNTFPTGAATTRIIHSVTNTKAPVEKGNSEILFGASGKGSGGPDLFGYEWIDSNEPQGPAYEWNDISSTGTEITNWIATGSYNALDEGYAGPISLGFDFPFYDNDKTEIYVSTNGFITFSTITSSVFSNDPIPDTDVPNEIIAPFWDDLDGSSQGNVYYKRQNNTFILQFTNWQKYPGSGSFTFQVVLYSSGKIMIYYESMSGTINSCTIGVENADGSDGLQVANNAAYIADQLALKIAADPEWMVMQPYTGMVYNGNSVAMEILFRSEDYPAGQYTMDVMVSTNDPLNPEITVPVRLDVYNLIPVELESFTAEAGGNDVHLTWTTATETNNSGFSVERKKTTDKNWTEAAFIEGKGTTTEKSVYTYTDKDVAGGIYSYRLKQVDLDGTVSYSSEIEVNVEIPEDFALYQNYPNPFNPATTIKFALPEASQVTVTVYNQLGEQVEQLTGGILEAGYHEITWNAMNYASGVYFYRIEAGNFNDIKKMMLLK